MLEVLHILGGALFTVAACTATGTLLLRCLRLPFRRFEAGLFAFVAGSGCLSVLVALLCVAHQARRGVFLWAGTAVIAGAARAVWKCRRTPKDELPWGTYGILYVLFILIFAAFTFCYFFNAMAPEVSPDGSGYHLGNVLRIWKHHGFDWDYHSLYAYLSQGMEMLFLVAFTFGGYSAASLVHSAFLTALPLLIVCYGRRFGFPRPAVFGAILIYACPIIGMDGVAAYTDVAVATVTFAVFYITQIWDDENNYKYLILIGLLAGSAYGLKYTAFVVFPAAVAFVWWRRPADRPRSTLFMALPAAIMIAPWILRNWIWLGNPSAPS